MTIRCSLCLADPEYKSRAEGHNKTSEKCPTRIRSKIEINVAAPAETAAGLLLAKADSEPLTAEEQEPDTEVLQHADVPAVEPPVLAVAELPVEDPAKGTESEHYCDVEGHENTHLLHDGAGGWTCPDCDEHVDDDDDDDEEEEYEDEPVCTHCVAKLAENQLQVAEIAQLKARIAELEKHSKKLAANVSGPIKKDAEGKPAVQKNWKALARTVLEIGDADTYQFIFKSNSKDTFPVTVRKEPGKVIFKALDQDFTSTLEMDNAIRTHVKRTKDPNATATTYKPSVRDTFRLMFLVSDDPVKNKRCLCEYYDAAEEWLKAN